MNMDSMAATRKVAILLLSFDQGLAAELLGRLPPEVVEQVTLEIASAGKVTREQQEFVLNQFKADFLSRPRMQPTGPETARELLERTLEITETQSIANDLGVDSVGFVELATLIGERFNVSFEESELTDGGFATLGALYELVSKKRTHAH